ncbi:MAG: hypothetical protein ACOC40_01590 [Thermoplasmatota archaeon]
MVWQSNGFEVKDMWSENKKTRRKNILPVLIVAIILISSLLVGGCLSSDTEPHYDKGVIDVTFKNNVTKEEAREIVHSFDNCTVDMFRNSSRHPLYAFVNVPEGEERKYVRLFENHTAVSSANLLWKST